MGGGGQGVGQGVLAVEETEKGSGGTGGQWWKQQHPSYHHHYHQHHHHQQHYHHQGGYYTQSHTHNPVTTMKQSYMQVSQSRELCPSMPNALPYSIHNSSRASLMSRYEKRMLTLRPIFVCLSLSLSVSSLFLPPYPHLPTRARVCVCVSNGDGLFDSSLQTFVAPRTITRARSDSRRAQIVFNHLSFRCS